MGRTSATPMLGCVPVTAAEVPVETRNADVDRARRDLARGRPVIVVDDLRGDGHVLVLAAARTTPEAMARLIRHSSGIVWVALDESRTRALRLPAMVPDHIVDPYAPEFTVSVDVHPGTTTGISAADRSLTAAALVDPDCDSEQLLRPGHIFPIRIAERAMLRAPSVPAAALELTRGDGTIAGAAGASLVSDCGEALDAEAIARFAADEDIVRVAVSDVARGRWAADTLVRTCDVVEASLFGTAFAAHVIESVVDGSRHLALVLGDVANGQPVPVATAPACAAGGFIDVADSPCRAQLVSAVEWIAAAGRGVTVCLPPEDHEHHRLGTALASNGDRRRATATTDPAALTAQCLRVLGVRAARLRDAGEHDCAALEAYGVECVRVAEPIAVAEGA